MQPSHLKHSVRRAGSVLRVLVWRLLLLNTLLVVGLPLAKLSGLLPLSWVAVTAPLWVPVLLAVPIGLWLRSVDQSRPTHQRLTQAKPGRTRQETGL